MDVIEASHFEKIKQFISDRPWWELKLFKYGSNWNVVLNNPTYIDVDSVMIFVNVSLGEAFKTASLWVSEQYAIQEREAKEVSLGKSSGDSTTLDSGTRISNSAPDEAEEGCHCGQPIHYYEEMNNFTRGLCLDCSTVRCDLDPAACK